MLPLLGINTWKEETVLALAGKILGISPRPLVLIDGRGGSGKTTFAKKLAEKLDANIVATDDVAWWLDPVHWDDELVDGIIQPWLTGENVAYTPSGWVKKGREGHISADPNKALIVEGSGACRKSLRGIATFTIWVDADPDFARERGIQRDIAAGVNGGTLESVTADWDWFDSVVDPFLLEQESWKYTDIIVSGSSNLISDTLLIAR
jgi:uridine kinase